MKYGEDLKEGLKREFLEELNIEVQVGDLALVSDSIDPKGGRHIINILFHCTYVSGEFNVGEEERLHGYDFFKAHELRELQIFPPIGDTLEKIMTTEHHAEYLGALWQQI